MFKTLKRDDITKWVYKLTVCFIFLFGIYLRAKLYILCDYFEDDECRLALAVQTRHFWQIFIPPGPLSCTPIFILVSKIIGEMTRYNEYALKFLPFVFSISSLFLFYRICKEYFVRKISVCFSLFLLTVNYHEIYFSSVFKTYSLEVFVTLLSLYYFPKISITELSNKKLIFLAAVITILPLISLPSLFFICLFVLMSLYKIYKSKTSYIPVVKILVPFLVVFTVYYFINLAPTKAMQLAAYPALWEKSLNPSFISVLAVAFRFLNSPNTLALPAIILTGCSIIYVLFNKNEYSQINFYVILSYILALLASYFHLYPLTLGRTAMFLLPVIILLTVKLLDVLKVKSFLYCLIVFFLIISYFKYFHVSYYKNINDVIPVFRNYSPKVLMRDMKSRFNKNTDIVISTENSIYSCVFYAVKEGFPLENIDGEALQLKNNSSDAYNYLNNLNSNKNYYFYLIKEYRSEPLRKHIQEWIKGQQVLYSRKENDSYLYYIKGIKPYVPDGQ